MIKKRTDPFALVYNRDQLIIVQHHMTRGYFFFVALAWMITFSVYLKS
ncbi:hypothetical protein DSUL_50049 [Desulfovibrionales bacterium]